MTYYSLITKEKIFEDYRLNVFCNQLYTFLVNRFGFDRVQNEFLIDGMVALIMQEEIPGPKFNKIEFITSDSEIFRYLKANVKSLTFKTVTISEDLIVITTIWNYNLYFKYTQAELTSFDYNDIFLRHKSEII